MTDADIIRDIQASAAEHVQRECTDTPPRWLMPLVLIAVFAWPVMAIVSGIYGRVF